MKDQSYPVRAAESSSLDRLSPLRGAVVLGIFMVGTICLAQVQTYCTDVAGNIACTSYGGDGSSSQSYCTSIAGNLSCTTYEQDNYSRVQVQHNYEAGQIIGSALGNVIMGAIEKHRAKKQARQDWDQHVQDVLGAVELACETDTLERLDPTGSHIKMGGETAARLVGCRTYFFTLNSFIHKHRKDFQPSTRNFGLLAEAVNKTPGLPDDLSGHGTNVGDSISNNRQEEPRQIRPWREKNLGTTESIPT